MIQMDNGGGLSLGVAVVVLAGRGDFCVGCQRRRRVFFVRRLVEADETRILSEDSRFCLALSGCSTWLCGGCFEDALCSEARQVLLPL